MSLRVCPIANVRAPVRKVWTVLTQPANYALWWDARTRSIVPMGEAESGQRIHAQSVAFGIPWNVDVLVEQVDVSRHTLDLMTTIPFGITSPVQNWIPRVARSRLAESSPSHLYGGVGCSSNLRTGSCMQGWQPRCPD